MNLYVYMGSRNGATSRWLNISQVAITFALASEGIVSGALFSQSSRSKEFKILRLSFTVD